MRKVKLHCINNEDIDGIDYFKEGKVYDATPDDEAEKYMLTNEEGERYLIHYGDREGENWFKENFVYG